MYYSDEHVHILDDTLSHRFLFCSACKQFVGDKENLQITSSGNEEVRNNTFHCLSCSIQLIISQIFTFCLTYIVIIYIELAPF